jgi:serine protease
MNQGTSRWLLLLIILLCPITFVAGQEATYFRMPAEAGPHDLVPGAIIFKLKPEAAPYAKSGHIEIEAFNNTLKSVGAAAPERVFPRHQTPAQKFHHSGQPLVDLSLIYEVNIRDDEQLEAAINAIYATGLVEYAQPRYIPRLFYTPNDPFIGSQYYLESIQAFDAWSISKGDTNIVIGITDTGIDLNHPDLIHAIKYNYDDPINGEDSDNDGFVDNFHGWDLGEGNNNPQYNHHPHGVHVSGIAAATADNGTGIAGTGFHSKLLPVKIDDEFGRLVMAYEGIVYAADQGAQVINCSWGGSLGAGQFGQDIVSYAALNRDAVVIAAAGNSDNQVPFYPASYENVMSVAATNINDVKWTGSSYGIMVDVAAPGANILSTWVNGTYVSSSGTSMAAPVVAGAAAILRDYFPDYSALQIAAQLKVTTDNIDTIPANASYQGLLGTGRINLYRALTETHHPYIRLTGHVMSSEDFAALEPGDEVELASFFQNLLAPTGNITATLTSASPHVQIDNPTVNLGPIGTNETVDNISDPFALTLLPSLPPSHEMVFTITFTNEQGEYAGRQRFRLLMNVDYVNISFNDITTTITSKGTLGYNYPNFGQGYGFVYNDGRSMLKCAGLILGSSSSKVVDNIYGAAENSFNQFFVSEQNARLQEEPHMADAEISGIFTDAQAEAFAMGLQVDYTVYFWEDEPNRKFLILEYHIINKSVISYPSFYAGFFADWVLRDNKNHRAAFDAVNRMGYAFSATGGYYTGIQLLTEGGLRHYAFDNQGFGSSIKISDGFTGFEKYTALRTNRLNAGVFDQDNDISTLMSSGPYNLLPNDTLTVAFAMLAGDHLADLQHSAQAAYRKYYGLDDDPTNTAPVAGESPGWLVAYPNPAREALSLQVKAPYSGAAVLKVSDLNGRTLLVKNISAEAGAKQSIKIDTSGFAPGRYILQLSGKGYSQAISFIRME